MQQDLTDSQPKGIITTGETPLYNRKNQLIGFYAHLVSSLYPLSIISEVGRAEATGDCSPEIKRHVVHFGYPPVPAPPTVASQWRRGFPEQNP